MKKNSLYVCVRVKKTFMRSYLILRLLAVLIKYCYRLSTTPNLNLKPIFLAEVSLVENRPIKNELSYFKTFGRFDEILL